MPMIAAELHALRPKFESWEALAAELRVKGGARTLAPHKGPACRRRKVSPPLYASVADLFEREYPFPLPEYQKSIRARLTAAKLEKRWPELLKVIVEIEGIVTDSAPKEPLNAAGLKYLEFLGCHARAVLNPTKESFGDQVKRRRSLARALAAAFDGRAIIAKALNLPDCDPRLKELDVWLFLNWVVAIGSYVFRDKPPEERELSKKYQSCNALSEFRAALDALPHEWRVPYNGLDVASRLGACQSTENQTVLDHDLALFYRKLLSFDPGFADFSYTPGEVLSIEENPGFSYFRERYELNPEAFGSI